MDHIEILGLRARGHHGVLPEERERGQPFVVDLVLERELVTPAQTDALGDTVDYGALAQQVAAAVSRTRFALIEALADHLAGLALAYPGVEAVTVRVAKPRAPMTVDVDEVAVVLHRTREDPAGTTGTGP